MARAEDVRAVGMAAAGLATAGAPAGALREAPAASGLSHPGHSHSSLSTHAPSPCFLRHCAYALPRLRKQPKATLDVQHCES